MNDYYDYSDEKAIFFSEKKKSNVVFNWILLVNVKKVMLPV